jgi:enoyl-CoA hydratase/carnithine racemase
LVERSFDVARELSLLLPQTFATTKRAVRRPLFEAVERTAAGDAAAIDAWCSPEVLEQMAAFAEKHIKRKG